MAKLEGETTITKGEVSQTIDLEKHLGRVPTELERQLFFEKSKDLINDRSKDGKSVHGTKFTQYSKEYAEFKGVARSNVDMTLNNNMLDSIEEGDTTSSNVKIQMPDGVETLKMFNHQSGDTVTKRQAFGINKKEAKRLAKEVDAELGSDSTVATAADLLDFVENSNLFGTLFGGGANGESQN